MSLKCKRIVGVSVDSRDTIITHGITGSKKDELSASKPSKCKGGKKSENNN